MQVQDSDEKKWILIASVAGASSYFIGQFNGTHFTEEVPQTRLDYGVRVISQKTNVLIV